MDNAHRAPRYRDLLGAAYSLGRADGLFAAEFEPEETQAASSVTSQGRTPEEFARWLWDDGPGTPPSGLTVNAPLWYARGFADGLADERVRVVARRRDAFAWLLLRTRALPRGTG